MATVGILITGNTSPEAFLQGFRAALAAAGLIEGQNVQLEVRSAEGSDTLLPQKATELVRLKADVIVASLTPAVQAARHATSDIPIVMAAAGHPVATGPISRLPSPGRAETSPAYRVRPLRLRARDSNSSASCFPPSGVSPCSPTRPILSHCPSLRSSARARAASAWRSNQSRFGRMLRKRRPSKR